MIIRFLTIITSLLFTLGLKAQIIKPISTSFDAVIIIDYDGATAGVKGQEPKILKELATQSKLKVSGDSEVTYITFSSSVIGGENVSIVNYAEVINNKDTGGSIIKATSTSIMHDKKLTWIFYYDKHKNLIAIEYFIPKEGKSFFFTDSD